MSFLRKLISLVQPKMYNPVIGSSMGGKPIEEIRKLEGENRSFLERIFPYAVTVRGTKYIPKRVIYLDEESSSSAPVATKQQQPQIDPTIAKYMEELNPENPYREILAKVFEERAKLFDRILRWGDITKGTYGVDYGGENLYYDPRAENFNTNNTLDRGLFQINSFTFEDFMNRKGPLLNSLGIYSYEDMYDPYKNALMAKIIQADQGFGAWKGAPKDLLGR